MTSSWQEVMGHHMIAILQITPKWGFKQGFFLWSDSQHSWLDGKPLPRKTAGACRASYHLVHDAPHQKESRAAGYDGGLQIRTWIEVCERGQIDEAVEALDLLVQRGAYVGSSVFYGVLKRCTAQKDLVHGSHVHALAVKSGYEADAFLANHIICMYASHGRLEKAMQVFTKVPSPSRYMWASIILAHARHGQPAEAIHLYREMRESTVKPDNHIFMAVLKACASAKDLYSGREVHADILATADEPGMFVATGLVDMYSKCGSMLDARKVFDSLPTRDVVTWNAMIAGYSQLGLGHEALGLYATMQQQGMVTANQVTYMSLLQACASIGDLHQGKQLHSRIRAKGLEGDVVLGNCLIDMYSKCGSLEDARRVFDNLPTRNVITWTAMISGYTQHGLGQKALGLYTRMQQECITPADAVTYICLLQACASIKDLRQGRQLHAQIQESGLETDLVLGNCLVDMYAKCGSLDDSRRVFDSLTNKDVVSWNAMISGYAQHGCGQEALALYACMEEEGIIPKDAVTLVSLLQACGSVAGLEKGKEIHGHISKLGLQASHLTVANALIDMYGKCGSMADAQEMFDALLTRDIVSWNALMAGFARQGDRDLVFDCFDRLRQAGLQPNGVTFLSVLTVCSHVGLVDEGESYFKSMIQDYSISPTIEHYTCMVDLLGRTGQVEKAMQMVRSMPFQPDGVVWRTMLGACRKWRNVDLGRQAFQQAVTLDKNDAAAYVLMSNILAAAQMQEEARQVQGLRVKNGAWKKPGQSWWTDIAGVVHTFVVGGKHHPEWRDIDAKLKVLFLRMKKHGYVPHLESVLRDLPEDEKEPALCGHSEKIAIAYALVKTPAGATIRVVKNLRVCEDCHKATALISKIEQRTIICRDASRFHVYKDGKCSCGDYW